ncbi:MAG TPA: IS110 family transposase [Polyangiaceae bacterium]|nr:IS110 family transposase [Polyangiaceae bacterium]
MAEAKLFVGIDWGSETHQVCVINAQREKLLEYGIEHSGSALTGLAEKLLQLAGGDPQRVAVAIEVPRGPVVEALLEREIPVFAINPKQLDRFRDRHTVAGAKDDRRDALVLADSLRTDQSAFRRVQLGDANLVQLRELCRLQEELKAERNALGNRLREQLHRYFPQILELGSVYDSPWIWALLTKAPTPQQAARLSVAKLGSLLKLHHIRRLTPEQVRDILKSEPLHVAPGVLLACQRSVASLLPRLQLAHEHKHDVEREIGELLEQCSKPDPEGKVEHRDALLLQSLPGLGKLVCATMLAEASEALARRDYTTLRGLCGVAPVTRRSGKQLAVAMRHSCNHRLRSAVHYWATNAPNYDDYWKARYHALRAKGHQHARAVRGIADRLLAVLIAILKSGKPYDPTHKRAVPAALVTPAS